MRCLASSVLFLLTATVGLAVDFEAEVEPVLSERCHDCHGPEKQKGGLRLDRLASMLRGGDSGYPAVVPGKPDDSFLLKAIRHEDPEFEMPPKGGPLSRSEIALVEKWIAEGARVPERYGRATEELTHWSFVPVRRSDAAANIDGFVRNRLAKENLRPSPEADRRTLIRRLYFVMLGLPPTPDEVREFEADNGGNAWGELVEKVLASPHYGERWATHWLDIVRFGETNGFETNRERSSAWRYRDWVIDAFNNDKPYDQFVRDQIAGDALGDGTGTGFLVAGPVDVVKGRDELLGLVQRMNELDDMINATGTTFLGLTTGCARCHNHKFDPITQKDYYSLQAVFAGVRHGDRPMPVGDEAKREIDRINGEIDDVKRKLETLPFRPPVNAKRNEEKFPARQVRSVRFVIEPESNTQACIDELEIFSSDRNVALADAGAKASSSGDFAHPLHKLEHINDGRYGNARSWIVASAKGGWVQIALPEITKIDRIVWGRDREGKYGDRLARAYRIDVAVREGEWETLVSSRDRLPAGADGGDLDSAFPDLSADEAVRGRRWLERLESLCGEKAKLETSVLAYAGNFEQPGPTHRLYRGEPKAKREEVGPGAIEAFGGLNLDRNAPEQERRVALARWIASNENPLTARVMVNRLWQFHFGTGLVDTPSDFGRNGTPPSHPELLDWLAAELMDNGWSLKHVHRLILMSRTWRQDSRPRADAVKKDAGTRLLWRFPTRRLEAEGIRDAILAVSGALDLGRAGGPGFSPFEVEPENVVHYHPKKTFGPEDWRRMVYMMKVRQEREAVFGVFDCPDSSQAVPKRGRSTTPLQALNLLNSQFVMQQAGLFAERLKREAASPKKRIERAWRLCFNRLPDREELADAIALTETEGWTQFARAMLNANEFVFIP